MKSSSVVTQYDTATLPNGLRLLIGRVPQATSVAIGVWARVGGRHEPAHVSGISHFLEHLVFKGTRRRSCEQLKQGIEGTGGVLNGFTGEEFTCYLAKVLKPRVAQALDVLTDMLLHPRLHPDDIEKERTVVLEEIRMYLDQPAQHVHDVISGLLWPDHPLGRSLAGTPETMARITRQDLQRHRHRFYTPRNLVVSLVGDVSLPRVRQVLLHAFRGQRGGVIRQPSPAPRVPANHRLRWEHRDTEQIHLCLASHAVARRHPARFTVDLLHGILGANMSSRLFREVREKRALAYEISSHVKHYQDTGGFIVMLGCEPRKLIPAVEVVLHELARVARRGVSRAELKRAKAFYRGQLLMGQEDTMEHMLWLGECALMEGRIPTVDATLRALDHVERRDLRLAARKLFQPGRLRLAVVGPRDAAGQRTLEQLLRVA